MLNFIRKSKLVDYVNLVGNSELPLTSSLQIHREKGLVESKHMWFIFVPTHVVSCRELFNKLNQLTKRVTVTY